jgi:hypothetical protein
MLHWNFSQQTQLIQSIQTKTHVSGHFGQFHYSMKVVAKLAEQGPLTHKFVK